MAFYFRPFPKIEYDIDNLDLDYIETLIRQKFLFSKEGETIYIIKDNDAKN